MLSLRLSRVGKKKQPTYRMIVTEKTRDPWGKHLEILGSYNPLTNPSTINLKGERIKYWIEKGAQASPTVHNLLVDAEIIKGEKVRATSPKKKKSADSTDKGKAESAPSESKETPAAAEEKPAEAPAEKPAEEVKETPAETPTETKKDKPAEEAKPEEKAAPIEEKAAENAEENKEA